MVVLHPQPVGIDKEIDNIQQSIYPLLLSAWNMQDSEYMCYGRCYRNLRNTEYYPEVFTVKNDYKEVLLDDKLKALSFFGIADNTGIKGASLTTVAHVIFFVNLEKVKPLLATRGDNEARQDAHDALKRRISTITGMTIGIASVLNEYTGWRKSLMNGDMHPFHCFRFDFQLVYSRNNICNNLNYLKWQ